jgi:hypothetical protein
MSPARIARLVRVFASERPLPRRRGRERGAETQLAIMLWSMLLGARVAKTSPNPYFRAWFASRMRAAPLALVLVDGAKSFASSTTKSPRRARPSTLGFILIQAKSIIASWLTKACRSSGVGRPMKLTTETRVPLLGFAASPKRTAGSSGSPSLRSSGSMCCCSRSASAISRALFWALSKPPGLLREIESALEIAKGPKGEMAAHWRLAQGAQG